MTKPALYIIKNTGIGEHSASIHLLNLQEKSELTSSPLFEIEAQPLPLSVDSNPALLKLADAKNLLMLQGPIGPLFDRVTDWKIKQKTNCYRIAFNAGDVLHCRALKPARYTETIAEWPQYLRRYIKENAIDTVLLFGQTRRFHQAAAMICRSMKVTLLVMEEGYIRPGFITLEQDGVNAHSSTLKNYSLSPNFDIQKNIASNPSRHHFLMGSLHAMTYYTALLIKKNKFPNYQHHRETNPLPYIVHWLKSGVKKLTKTLPDSRFVKKLNEASYFFVPLQLDTDAQVINHSDFESCINFLQFVMDSFAKNTSGNTQLVIKQHPLARGENSTEKFALAHAKVLGIENRVTFLYEGHIPTLIKHSAGVITINSTVGLQAIYQTKPLKVLGNAVYENPLVTDSKPLNQFWQAPMPPYSAVARNLHNSLRILTQAPAAIYAPRSVPLPWPENRGTHA